MGIVVLQPMFDNPVSAALRLVQRSVRSCCQLELSGCSHPAILDQGIDMLRLKRAGIHAAKSQCNQLVRDEHQLMQAIGLGCVTAIAVAITELFKLVVQISHSAITFR